MRSVRVLGLSEGGHEVICEDPANGEKFIVARDDKLRAAARGDLRRFGEIKVTGDSDMRPKEIQARIRSGATIDEVAALAGTSARRVERFAYPVLLERATMADRARQARPSIDGINASQSVEETVKASLSARGYEAAMSWDAHREDDVWVLTLSWQAGHTENRAHWTFHPGSAGGTLTARDEAAAEIVDPALRVLRPLREPKPEAVPAPAPVLPSAAKPDHNVFDRLNAALPTRPAERRRGGVAAAQESQPVLGSTSEPTTGLSAPQPTAEELVEQTVSDERAGVVPARAAVAKTGTDGPSGRGARKSGRPVMPSWEDVLLGTKSTGRA